MRIRYIGFYTLYYYEFIRSGKHNLLSVRGRVLRMMLTHRCFPESYFVLDYFHYILGGGRRMELDGVVLAVHEMKPGVNQSPVNGAQYLLSRRWPLPSPRAFGLRHALGTRHEHIIILLSMDVGHVA